MSQGIHQLKSEMHALQETHHALSTELAAEKMQHANTEQQLLGVQQDNLHLGDDLKARLLIYDLLPIYCVSHNYIDSHVNMHATKQ